MLNYFFHVLEASSGQIPSKEWMTPVKTPQGSQTLNKQNDDKKEAEKKTKPKVAFDEMGDGLEKQDLSEKGKMPPPASNIGDTKEFLSQVLAYLLLRPCKRASLTPGCLFSRTLQIIN